MIDLPAKVREALLGSRLISLGERLLVGVSGGMDSMVLLHILHRLSPELEIPLVIGHVNHGLRGAESDQDQALVESRAHDLGLVCVSSRVEAITLAAERGISVEMAARDLRHHALAVVARAQGCRTIALAHHADDRVETFLLRLLRGGGGQGLSGLRPEAPSPADPSIRLLRPLLGCHRAALADYARSQGVEYREDASNRDLAIHRNQLRHELLPWLREHCPPGLDEAILRTAEVIGAESDFVGDAARDWLEYRPMAFERLHPGVQRRVVLQQLIDAGVPPSFDLVETLRMEADSPVSVAPGRQLWRDLGGNLCFGSADDLSFDPASLPLTLEGTAGRVVFGGLVIEWQIEDCPGVGGLLKAKLPQCEYFDAESVGARVSLRYWMPGDRFHPLGLAASAKLQDLFTNAKIPAKGRRGLALAVGAAEEVFWVEGLRIGERFKLQPGTRKCLKWRWEKVASGSPSW